MCRACRISLCWHDCPTAPLFWGAHAPRVLSPAPRRRFPFGWTRETFRRGTEMGTRGRVRSPDLNRNEHEELVRLRSKIS